MVSLGIVQTPQVLLGSGVDKVRCMDERKRLQCSYMRGVHVVSERGGHGQMVAARLYRWYCCVAIGSGLAR